MSFSKSKVRIQTLRQMKIEGRKIVCVTAYDAITGRWADKADIDLVLVGDSLCGTSLGLRNTLKMKLEWTIHHASAVARTVKRALRVGDMPFMTFKVSSQQALTNCARLVQEGSVEAVKLEGGAEIAPTVHRLVQAGLPVLGHIGLLPQSFHTQGGFRLQGGDEQSAKRLLEDARALEDAGVFGIVLEKIPGELAVRITKERSVPTIGIGAGNACNGQILVLADVLGMTDAERPKLAKGYTSLHNQAIGALGEYAKEIREGRFPGPEHTYES